jgi:hypothetical protein
MVAIEKTKKRTRLVNPADRTPSSGTRAAQKRRPRKENPGELITLGALINPQQRGSMQNKKSQKSNTKPKAARKSNPVYVLQAPPKPNGKKKPPRKSNPNILGTGKEMIESGAYALAGLVATRQLPQLVVKDKNTGWKGYLANAASAIAAAYAAGKFAGARAGSDVLIGGGLYLVNRVLTEQFSPVGKVLALSGVGDAAAASSVGRVRQDYFPLPVQRDRSGKPIIPQAVVDAVLSQLPAPAGREQGFGSSARCCAALCSLTKVRRGTRPRASPPGTESIFSARNKNSEPPE